MARKSKRKVQKRFAYEGFGFPVTLLNVPMIRVRGVWTPDVDYNRLSKALLFALALKPARLTGSEIRFIRLSFSMTLQDFANRLSVTHPAVLKWEKARGSATAMSWATEKDIRLLILQRFVKPKEFVKLYVKLAKEPQSAPKPVALDIAKVA